MVVNVMKLEGRTNVDDKAEGTSKFKAMFRRSTAGLTGNLGKVSRDATWLRSPTLALGGEGRGVRVNELHNQLTSHAASHPASIEPSRCIPLLSCF